MILCLLFTLLSNISVKSMTQVILPNLNPLIIEQLQILAKEHNRSLPDEITAILEEVVPAEVIAKKVAREAAWSKIDAARKRHQGQTFSDSVELLQEDRNR